MSISTPIINLSKKVKVGIMGHHEDELMWSVAVVRGDVVEVRMLDGMETDYIYEIHLVNNFANIAYCLNRAFTGRIETICDDTCGYVDINVRGSVLAEHTLEKIKAKGVVNLEHWHEIKLPF